MSDNSEIIIPSAVLSDAGMKAYEILEKDIPAAIEARRLAQKVLDDAVRDEKFAKQKLCEYTQFLQDYAYDDCKEGETWWDILKINPNYGLERACYNCIHCTSAKTGYREDDCPAVNKMRDLVDLYSGIEGGATYDYHFEKDINAFAIFVAEHCGGFKYSKDKKIKNEVDEPEESQELEESEEPQW